MAHSIVDTCNPQSRQLIVGVRRRNLLKRYQGLGIPPFLRQLNGRWQIGSGVIDRLCDVLCEQQKKNGKQHTSGFGC
jgi:hypothetical protein